MTWWQIVLTVWLIGDVGLSINFLIRAKHANQAPFTWKVVGMAFYDSLFWPLFAFFYGAEGVWREITGKPW